MTETRTRQEIFDLAWNGLKAQEFQQSADEDGRCKYRGPDGIRCAVGHCIPDELYTPGFEGNAADCSCVLEAARISEDDGDFVVSLQCQHDYAYDPTDMEARLRRFAAEHSLTRPVETGARP